MSESHSTPPPNTGKPAKPYPEFPLTAHPAGYWCKKIRGKLHYFGKWDDPDGALTKYLEQKDALHAGRKPRPDTEGLIIKDACNAFLNAKQALLDAGELSPRTWSEYKETTDLLVSVFGKTRLVADLDPDDFAQLRNRMVKRWGPVRLRNAIQRVRCVFKHALDAGLIDKPVRFGPGFKRPSMKTMRLHRAEQGPKLFTAEEIRKLIDAAGTPMKAMLLLGINCGFGNSDCGNLPLASLDLERGWIDFPRPKTGIPRRCPLWPETMTALREALAKRPESKDAADAGLVFITKRGLSWAKDTSDNPVTKETAKLLRALRINGRKGLGFYTLRHVFRTIADEAKDQPAVDFIMGHEVPHMSSVYRERISDERLRAVTDQVRRWLFPPAKGGE
ncbi:MAG: site-specific integrase [Gemmataceae bacterium]|nr:site-specific integrase [Gemmataceae bacterium]